MDLAANDNEISWKKMAVVKRQNPKTGKEMNKREQINVHDPVPYLVREFVAEIKTLSVHLFQAHWQITQFAELTKNTRWESCNNDRLCRKLHMHISKRSTSGALGKYD